ncbi:MAG: DUF3791 domain-containing protein [Ruminococcus sp.]|jgi:hypothetical protein|nr:DUF3791 domain-containing protein [Ruminococcus sp.]
MRTKEYSEIQYYLICVLDFAEHHKIEKAKACDYLVRYGGIEYLEKFYEIEHTLSMDDTIETLTVVCQRNGGGIKWNSTMAQI